MYNKPNTATHRKYSLYIGIRSPKIPNPNHPIQLSEWPKSLNLRTNSLSKVIVFNNGRLMSEAKDPAIKLFGKTIQLPEIVAPAVDSGGVNPSSSAEAPLHDGPPSEDRPASPNSSTEEHNSDGVGEEQEAEKDMTAEPLTDTKEEDEAQPMMSEESKDPNITPIVNENTKTRDSEAADVDDPNTEEAQSETSNSQEKTLKKPDKILPCPRCNSMETKFCYYNNYNVNQPRHFCKNCQRYWTAGGTMRNVPVGAGRRKNKYSASQYRHVAVSEALQNARVDLPNGIHHPALKTNGTVLTFGSDTPLCESMTSVLKISGKTMLNGFHKPEEVRIPVSYGPGEIVDDHSSGSSVTAPNSKDEVGKPGLQNPVIQSCQSFPPQLPCYPGAPWPYPWNTGQWNSPVTQVSPPGFCPPGFPMPFYPSAPYWGCSVPVPGPWNVHWLTPTNLSPSQAAPASGPNCPTLGKHSRDENMPKSTGSFDEDSVKENNPEKCLWVPKTLRIDDPGEAAKSSIWATLGIKNERADVVSGGGLFKAFQSKENEKGHISNPSSVLHANPAAMSRSQSFRESA